MNLNKREKVLGGAIVFILLGWLIYQYGVMTFYQEIKSRHNSLEYARKTYNGYISKLKRADDIKNDYEAIVGVKENPGDDGASDPEKEFSEFVSDLCKRLGFAYPRIDPPGKEEIDNVDDHIFITLTVHTNGTLESVAKLLKGFDREAILIRALNIRSRLDSDEMSISITVARMVKIEPENTEKVKRPERDENSKTRPASSIIQRTQRTAVSEEEK